MPALRSLACIAATTFGMVCLVGCASDQTAVPLAVPAPVAPGAAPPVATKAYLPVDPLVGKWGLAAFHREQDRPRTEKEARAQCANPYVIAKGPEGGVMMHVADEAKLYELKLKQGADGKRYIGPEGESAGEFDREVIILEPKLIITKFVDPEVAGRYGNSIYVRCGA